MEVMTASNRKAVEFIVISILPPTVPVGNFIIAKEPSPKPDSNVFVAPGA
jgi:hypothetical protein